jgi:hypothetical protein
MTIHTPTFAPRVTNDKGIAINGGIRAFFDNPNEPDSMVE